MHKIHNPQLNFTTSLLFNRRRAGESNIDVSYETEDLIPDQYKDLYSEVNGKWQLTGVTGLKTQADIDRLQTALTKERNDHKNLRTTYAPLAGRTVQEIQADLDSIDELKLLATGKVDETKMDALVEGRVKAKIAPVQRELETTRAQMLEKDALINMYKDKEVKSKIGSAITQACKTAKVIDGAIDDATILGERLFEIDDAGNVVAKDGVGITPGITPADWLADIMPKKTHWFGVNVGGGSNGGKGGGYANNPYSAENWNLSEQMSLYKSNPAKALQLAKIHGVDPLRPVQPQPKK